MLCDTHRRHGFDLQYERISAEWDKYEAAQEANRVKEEAERVRKEKLERKADRERLARGRIEQEKIFLMAVEELRATVYRLEEDGRGYQDLESPDELKGTQPPQEDKGRHSNTDFLVSKLHLVWMRIALQSFEEIYEKMRNEHRQAGEEEAQAEAEEKEAEEKGAEEKGPEEKEAEERDAREQKAQEDAAREKEAQEKAAKAEAEREKAEVKAKMEKEAREKARRERERLAEQRSQEVAERAREAQQEAARERLARQAMEDEEASDAGAAEEGVIGRMTPELEEKFKLFQRFLIWNEKESQKAGRKEDDRVSACKHCKWWWPQIDEPEDCEFCGIYCPHFTLRCPDCYIRACVPCKLKLT